MFIKRMLATLMLAGISFYGCAADDGMMRINFSGTVLDPPDCVINNNQVINLAFGNVSVKRADGKSIVKTVDYNMVCKGDTPANAQLAMQLSGTPGFANDVLATDLDGLGIRFYQDGVPVKLKQWFALPTVANSMVLTASPIQDPNKPTSGGSFNAIATLMVTFQ